MLPEISMGQPTEGARAAARFLNSLALKMAGRIKCFTASVTPPGMGVAQPRVWFLTALALSTEPLPEVAAQTVEAAVVAPFSSSPGILTEAGPKTFYIASPGATVTARVRIRTSPSILKETCMAQPRVGAAFTKVVATRGA